MFYRYILALLIIQLKCELKFVVEVFRHGAREKIHGENNNGQLTAVGQRQHFLLGNQLRKEYIQDKKFLSNTYSPQELNVISTDYNRTIMSAESQLYGMYPLGSGSLLTLKQLELAIPEFESIDYNITHLGLNSLPEKFQPIPVRLDVPDSFLKLDMQSSKSKQLQEEIKNSDAYKQFLISMENTIQEYKEQSGNIYEPTKGLQQISSAYDDIISDLYQGMALPEYLQQNQDLHKNMIFIHDIIFFLDFFRSPKYTAFYSNKMFKFILEKIFDSNLFDGSLKWQMLSAHDTTVAVIAAGLNITSFDCLQEKFYNKQSNFIQCGDSPKYTANIILEFHENEQKAKFVKARYNGKYVYMCEREQHECPFYEFIDRINYLLRYNDDDHNSLNNNINEHQKHSYFQDK